MSTEKEKTGSMSILSTDMETTESMRFQSDIRQIGALIMVTGICAIFQPLPGVAGGIGPYGTTPNSGVPLWSIIGGVCLITVGIVSVFVGYNQLVHNWGNKTLTGALIVLTQTAYIPYITLMTNIGQVARTGMGFIPMAYNPSSGDNKFVGAIGILAVVTYGFTFVGSIAFMQFSLFTYQAGKPHMRNAGYYGGRMSFYSLMLLLAGLGQLALGVYIKKNIGGGYLNQGPVVVAVYAVSFPAISIFLGIFQVMNAIWGLCRSRGLLVFGENDLSYQVSMFLLWVLQLVLQALVQVAILPGDAAATATTTIAAISFGLNLMPAFLDYKMRTMPEEITPEYYGVMTMKAEPVATSSSPLEDQV